MDYTDLLNSIISNQDRILQKIDNIILILKDGIESIVIIMIFIAVFELIILFVEGFGHGGN